MPRFTKGDLVIETSLPTEAAELRRDGFKESKARTAAVRNAEAEAVKAIDSAESEKPATSAKAADAAKAAGSTKSTK